MHAPVQPEAGTGDVEYALTATVLVLAVVLVLLATPLGDVVQQLVGR